MSPQTLSFTHFYQFENSLYFMKHDPEAKSFIQISTFIILTRRLTSRVVINFVDETRSCTSINTQLPHLRDTTLENTLWENLFYELKPHLMHLLVYTGQVSWRLNDNFVRGSVFYTALS